MLRRCAIGRWRGYRTSSFVAFLDDGTPIAESPSFRARGGGPPESTHAANRAHEALVADLVARGWTRDTHAPSDWYAAEFVRAFDAPLVEDDAWTRVEPAVAPVPLDLEPVHIAAALRDAAPPEIAIVSSPPPEADAEPIPTRSLYEPIPAEDVPRREVTRRGGRRQLIASIGVGAAAGVGVFLGFGHALLHEQASAERSGATHHAVPRRAAHVEHAAFVTHDVATSRVVHLVVSAPSRSSWLEVHRESAHGPILFTGELPVGRTLRLSGPKLWARFGAAGNLSIAADGKLLRLQGTIEHTFLPSD